MKEYTISKEYINNIEVKKLIDSINKGFLPKNVIYSNSRNVVWAEHVESVGKVAIKRFNYNFLKVINNIVAGKSRAQRAYDNSLILLENKFSTPEPIAYIDFKFLGIPITSVFITKYTDDREIAELTEKGNNKYYDEATNALAKLLADMHSMGIVYRDANPSNVLYHIEDDKVTLSLIDTNRMRIKTNVVYKEIIDELWRSTWSSATLTDVTYAYSKIRGYDPERLLKTVLAYKLKKENLRNKKRRMKSFFRSKDNK